ncbi:hypothetical protein ACHAW5_006626 [Stephanodiscus triporus]|uniref:GRAM domain-containing protein n=1 Tax=Stephanodiscus triporus TaxID=2934178 RepID=A0ABD3ML21_9STRA
MSEPATSDSIPPAPSAAAAADDEPQSQAQEEATAAAKPTIARGKSSLSMRRLSLSSTGRSIRQRSSEIFAWTLKMFQSTSGQAGASVEMLRGDSGSDFEGYATVHRGGGTGSSLDSIFNPCSCLKRKEGPRFLLIKGYHCFVFDDEGGTSPKYAIELIHRRAVVQPKHASIIPRVPHPGTTHESTYTTVHLETSLGDVEYRMTFAGDPDSVDALARRFRDAVSTASVEASTDQARKRLGHEGLSNKRASLRFAQTVGATKAKEQPEAPVSPGEIMAGMPSMGYN